jgi:hypothetical protein
MRFDTSEIIIRKKTMNLRDLRIYFSSGVRSALHFESKAPISRPQLPREIGTTYAGGVLLRRVR